MSSGFLTRTNSLPNLQYSSHHRSGGGGLGGQPSGSDLIATAATGLPSSSSSSLSTAHTAVAMSTSLSSVRTISGGGRKLNLYFHFFDVDSRQPAAPTPSERGGGSSGGASGDDDAAAGSESTELTTPPVRRNGDVSAGFGYRRFNTEMLVSRQNTPLPPPPVASRNGRAFLRTATGGSASDSDAAAASPDGADSSSSGSTQPAQKKPATSLVESLKFERPGRRSLEVMGEEVIGGSHSLVVRSCGRAVIVAKGKKCDDARRYREWGAAAISAARPAIAAPSQQRIGTDSHRPAGVAPSDQPVGVVVSASHPAPTQRCRGARQQQHALRVLSRTPPTRTRPQF